MVTASIVASIAAIGGCGAFLPFGGEEDEPPPPSSTTTEADAGGDGAAALDASGFADGSAEDAASKWTCVRSASLSVYDTDVECESARAELGCIDAPPAVPPDAGTSCRTATSPLTFCELCRYVSAAEAYVFTPTTCECR